MSLLACFSLVATLYGLPPRVLPAILRVEGGGIGTVHHNTDGSDDLGPMQINTRWLPALARYTGLPEAELRRRLLQVPCFNIAIGGAVLRTALDETGGDLLRAIGNYHSHTPALNLTYQAKVVGAAAKLFPPQLP